MNKESTRSSKTVKILQAVSLLLAALAFTACGGGGGSSSGGSSSSSDGGSVPTNFLSAEALPGGSATRPKTLKLTWEVDSEPDHYRVEINADGASGFADNELGDIAGDAAEFEFEMPLHLTMWDSAQLQLVALDDAEDELGRSDIIPLDQVNIDEMIGYFKGPAVTVGLGFGVASALSADGKTLAVAARELNQSGAVYVFFKVADEWSFQKRLMPEEHDSDDRFGFRSRSLTISADGSVLAVGAHGEDSNATGIDGDASDNLSPGAGAAYVFKRENEDDWTQQAYIKASNTGEGDSFGESVALSADGRRLAVGAEREDSNGHPANNDAYNSGALYVFDDDGSGWAQTAYIKGGDMTGDSRLGYSVALSADGNTLAAGASQYDGPGGLYVFSFDSDTSEWLPQAINVQESENDSDDLGLTIALSDDGNTLAAGAPYHYTDAAFAGAAVVYQRDGDSWDKQAMLTAPNPDAHDYFGLGLSLSGDGKTLAVSAEREDSASIGLNGDGGNNDAENAGAVYVYQLENEWEQKRYLKAPNTEETDLFGLSVTLSADGNTLFVSAPLEDSVATGIGGDWENNNGTDTGAVFVY